MTPARRKQGNLTPPTWDQFKAEVRKHDRDSVLRLAARISAAIARDTVPEESSKYGLNPWNIASVARTALAWSGFQRPQPTVQQFVQLCSMDANLGDEHSDSDDNDPTERAGRMLARLFFEQFPGQRGGLAEVARSILLFGSESEHPQGFHPEAMTPAWFERLAGGISVDEYVGAVFLLSVGAQLNHGTFDLAWLDGPAFEGLEEVIDMEAVRQTFENFLLTTPEEFKTENRRWQEHLPPAQKKYAFNPLQDKPFIDLGSDGVVAPWVQAVLTKASPPAVYFMGLRAHGEAFTRDLGHVYQHYVGRQLALISGPREVIPEVPYGPRQNRRDSCDWFLDLPGVVVLIECKARQPIESLRIGGDEWLKSVEGSINKGITQLVSSNQNIGLIASEIPLIDTSKPRVGLVITLEPFYVNNNPTLQQQLPAADLPVGVISIGDLEELVRLNANELASLLLAAPHSNSNNFMPISPNVEADTYEENRLLVDTWESIGFFKRIESYHSAAEDDDSKA